MAKADELVKIKALCLLFVICTVTSVGADDSLTRVLEKHQSTIGSLKAWHQIQSLAFKLAIKEPDFEVEGIYRVSRSGKMRIDIFEDGAQVFTEAYNGKQAWQWHPEMTEPKIITAEKAAALRHGIEMPGHLFTLLDMQQQGHQLEYIGDEKRGDTPAHILLLTLKDGHQKFYIIDARNGLMLANRDQRAFHPDIDQTKVEVESRPSDFRATGGVVRPFQTDNYDLTNNSWLGTTRIVDIKVNPGFDDGYFEPANTQAELFTRD